MGNPISPHRSCSSQPSFFVGKQKEKKITRQPPIEFLPNEVLAIIFEFATNNQKELNTLCRLRAVNRRWHDVVDLIVKPYWEKLKAEVQHASLLERISWIERPISSPVIEPQNPCAALCESDDRAIPLSPSYFSLFCTLSQELTGSCEILGWEAHAYEQVVQQKLDFSLKAIWTCIEPQVDFKNSPISASAESIRISLNDPVNAKGITRITRLDLTNMDLNLLPPEIGTFSHLSVLYISINPLASLPNPISNLSNLTQLMLSYTELTALPDTIGNLFQLTELDLCCNKLKSLPDTIGSLPKLKTLNLGRNLLTALPNTIGNLSSLIELAVFNNQLTSLPDTIGNLFQLTRLDVSYNQLSSLPPAIGNLPRLKCLYTGHNSSNPFFQ